MGLSEATAHLEGLNLRREELGIPPTTPIGEMPDELKRGLRDNAAMLVRHLTDLQKFMDRLGGRKTDDIPD
jgi:ABC-type transporter Mla subunit MlaD